MRGLCNMPSPPHEFPIPEELLYSNYNVTASLEDLWPLLEQQADYFDPSSSSNILIGSSAAEINWEETTFSSINFQLPEIHHPPWLIQQEDSRISLPPTLLEHDERSFSNLAYINATIDQDDTAVAAAYDQHWINTELLILPPSETTLLAAQENAGPPASICGVDKGKRKLDRELPSMLKSMHIPDNYDIHCLDHDEFVGTEDLLGQGAPVMTKKKGHNAKERARRMKLNASYLALGALLPQSQGSKKKRTMPGIIDKMVHYIPELKAEIEELNRKKDELLGSCDADRISSIRPDNTTGQADEVDHDLGTTVLVHEVSGKEELILQVCMKKKDVNFKGEEDNTFSHLVWNLEAQGLLLMGGSTNRLGDGQVSYNLHVQISASCSSHGCSNDTAALKEMILSWLDIYPTRRLARPTDRFAVD